MKNIDFGNYLYQLRKENNLTQRYVAYQLNVSDKTISKWELGKSNPDLEKLKLLSILYNVSLNELLFNQEEKEMKFLLAVQFLLCLCSFGFDALRRGEEPFRGTVKPHVPGFYILRLDGSRDISFDRELFCKEIPLPGKPPRTIQWILTERNFSRIPGKYRKTFPFEEKFVQSKGFGFPATLSPETGKRMTILHFEPEKGHDGMGMEKAVAFLYHVLGLRECSA